MAFVEQFPKEVDVQASLINFVKLSLDSDSEVKWVHFSELNLNDDGIKYTTLYGLFKGRIYDALSMYSTAIQKERELEEFILETAIPDDMDLGEQEDEVERDKWTEKMSMEALPVIAIGRGSLSNGEEIVTLHYVPGYTFRTAYDVIKQQVLTQRNLRN